MGLEKSGQSILCETVTASATVSSNRFVSASGAHATAAGNAIGVANFDAVSGDALTITTLGVYSVEAEEAIAVGAEIEVGTDGKAATQSAGIIVARAREAALAAGHKINVFMMPN